MTDAPAAFAADAAPDAEAELLVRRIGAVLRLTLNRPKALNALTLPMIRAMAAALERARTDDGVRFIVIDGAGPRGLCAGGDIKSLFDPTLGADFPATFWREEYRLDRMIAIYPKPVLAFMAGIVMGGGAGISVNASHRVVDASTRFAMPETGIGMVPDVGASSFLGRAPGELGTFLALTGTTIGAADAILAGIADVAIAVDAREAIIAELAAAALGATDTAAQATAILDRHRADPGPGELGRRRAAIDRAFAADSVPAILAALDEGDDWGRATAALIRSKSPTSSILALQCLRFGRAAPDLAACLRLEYRVVRRIALGPDFPEGVRAAVIDKDRNPHWRPARLDDVDPAAIAQHFAPLGAEDLQFPDEA